MFLIYSQECRFNCVDREAAITILDMMDVDGMEATRDAIDDGKSEYWSESFDFVTIECTVPWDMHSEIFV